MYDWTWCATKALRNGKGEGCRRLHVHCLYTQKSIIMHINVYMHALDNNIHNHTHLTHQLHHPFVVFHYTRTHFCANLSEHEGYTIGVFFLANDIIIGRIRRDCEGGYYINIIRISPVVFVLLCRTL